MRSTRKDRLLLAVFLTAIPTLVLDGAQATPAPWQSEDTEAETTDESDRAQRMSTWLQAIDFHFGTTEFSAASELNRHPLTGISTDLGHPAWHVAFAADFLASYGGVSLNAGNDPYYFTETTADLRLLQLRVGVRKTWHQWPIRPFAGGGAALLMADARRILDPFGTSESHDSQLSVHPWLSAGAVIPLRGHLALGFEATVMPAEFHFKSSSPNGTIDYETEVRPLSATAFLGWQARPSLRKASGLPTASGDDFEESVWVNSLNVTLGLLFLGNDVQPVEKPLQIRLATDFRKTRWPVALALDTSYFQGKNSGNDFFFNKTVLYHPHVVDLEIQGGDVGIGIRWTRKEGLFRPVFGGGAGLTVVSARAIEHRFGESPEGLQDTAAGGDYWFQAGGHWMLGPSFHLGFDLRYLNATIEFERKGYEQGVTLDGISAALLVGWR